MKLLLRLFLVAVSALLSQAQTPPSPAKSVPAAQSLPDPGSLLGRIQQEALGLSSDLGKLRIDKWKADSSSKSQARDNAESIQRNITNALPGMISAVRTAPQSLAANFKLYRNLNALYDVLASLGESAGAFGKREEYDVIAPHVAAMDDDRRAYGDLLAQMTASADSRIAGYQQAAAQATTAAQTPKKIIVDDTEPAPPPKKKARKKATSSASTPKSTSPSSGSSGSTSTPK